MVNFYNKLSPATKLLIHGLLAIVWSAVVTGGEAAYQNFTQSGHLNPSALLVTAWSAFLLYLIPAMYAFVPAHAQQLIKAAYDEKAQLYDALQRAQQIRSAQNVPAVQPPSHVVVPVPAALKSEDVSAISAQLAINLINLAAERAASTTTTAPVVQPVTPVPQAAYTTVVAEPVRHWGDTGVVPAIADQSAQVPFTV